MDEDKDEEKREMQQINFQEIRESLLNFSKAVGEIVTEAMGKINTNFVASFIEGMKLLPERLNRVQVYLRSRGWYSLSELDFDDLFYLSEEDDIETERVMIKFVEDRQNEIIEKTCQNHILRKEIIMQAYEAHNCGKYALSIPVFLIQADGIANDMFGESLYSKTKGGKTMKLSKIYDQLVDGLEQDLRNFDLLMLSPLSQITSINMNINELKKVQESDSYFGPLNRHEVIHGYNNDYPSKSNSLRCILLLDFLNEVNEEYLKKERTTNAT